MLSAEQQKTVQESLWVVNTVLKDLGLQQDEDLRQDANLYLCRCLERFNPSHNVKWTTYAYKNILMFVKRKSQIAIPTIDFTSFADNTSDYIVARPTYPQITLGMLRGLLRDCTAEERQIVFLRYKGYKTYEIGKLRHQSPRYIAKRIKEIREKLLKNS